LEIVVGQIEEGQLQQLVYHLAGPFEAGWVALKNAGFG